MWPPVLLGVIPQLLST